MSIHRHSADPGGSTLVLADERSGSPRPLEREVWFWFVVLLVLLVAAVIGGWLGLRARHGAQRVVHRPAVVATSRTSRPPASTPSAHAARPSTAGSVTVPDVSGERFPDARKAIRAAGLVADLQQVASSAPKHAVVSQSPAPGATATPGSHVLLAVSLGPAKQHGRHGEGDKGEHRGHQ